MADGRVARGGLILLLPALLVSGAWVSCHTRENPARRAHVKARFEHTGAASHVEVLLVDQLAPGAAGAIVFAFDTTALPTATATCCRAEPETPTSSGRQDVSFEAAPQGLGAPGLRFVAAAGATLKLIELDVDGQAAQLTSDVEAQWPDALDRVTSRVSIASALCAIALVLLGSVWLQFWRNPGELSATAALACSAGSAVALGGFWTFVSYPGYLSGDSIDQWGQALAGRYSTWHPPLLAMLMHLTTTVTRQPALFTFLQGSLFWFGIFWALSVVVQRRRVWLLAAVLLAAHPVLWIYTSTLWKDVWVTIPGLIGFAYLVRYARERSIRHLAWAVAFLSLSLCFRHNAVSIAPVPVLAWLVLERERPWWKRALGALAILVALVLPSKLVLRAPSVQNASAVSAADLASPYLFGTLARLPPNCPGCGKTHDTIDAAFGPGTYDRVREKYTCACSLYLLWGQAALGRGDAIDTHRQFILDQFWQVAREHPRELLQHRLCSLKYWLQLPQVSYPFHASLDANTLGVHAASWLPELKARALRLAERTSETFLMRHYLFDLVLLLAVIVGLWRRDPVALIAGGLGLCYLAPFLIVDSCPDWRYQLFNYLLALLCLARFADAVVSRKSKVA